MENRQLRNTETTRCQCGCPVAKRIDSRKLEFIKDLKGQRKVSVVEYSGDECSVTCPECGKKKIFKTGLTQRSLTYMIAAPKK